jgi:hypothetical protein
MSKASQGPGWWEASDGKWYAPELYPAGWPPPVGTPTAELSSVQGPTDPWAPPAGPPAAGEVPQISSPPGVNARPDVIAAVLGAAGAGLVAVGSLLDWATVSGEGMAGTVNGLSDSNGAGTLAVGAVVAVAVGLLLAGQRRWWVGAGVAVAALVAVGLVVYSIGDLGDLSDDLPQRLTSSGVDPGAAATAGLENSVGLWLTAAGSCLALVAGLAALARREATAKGPQLAE